MNQNPDSGSSTYRPLGNAEWLMWQADQHATTNPVLMCKVDGVISKKQLHHALTIIRHSQPALNARATKVKNRIIWKQDQHTEIPVSFHTSLSGLDHYVEKELNHPFPPYSSPLFRVAYFYQGNESALVISASHALSDGRSLAHLAHSIFSCCEDNSDTSNNDHATLAALEDYIPKTYQGLSGQLKFIKYKSSEIWRWIRGGFPEKIDNYNDSIIENDQRCIRFKSIVIEQDDYLALKKQCKALNLTLHSLTAAAQAKAYLNEFDSDSDHTIVISSAVDLRPRLSPKIPKSYLGFYVSGVLTTLTLNINDTLERIASKFHRKLYKDLASGLDYLWFRAVPPKVFFPTGRTGVDRFAKVLSKQPHQSCISNIGDLSDLATPGRVKIRSLSVMAAPHARWPFASYISTIGNQMLINIVYDENKIDQVRANKLAACFYESLLNTNTRKHS